MTSWGKKSNLATVVAQLMQTLLDSRERGGVKGRETRGGSLGRGRWMGNCQ